MFILTTPVDLEITGYILIIFYSVNHLEIDWFLIYDQIKIFFISF